MSYKSYAKKKDTPSRKSRKSSRASVFLFNSHVAKARRKAARLERKSNQSEF